MSTFNGLIREIPGIKVDNFTIRSTDDPIQLYFLSHVHSDHLAGLDRTTFHGQIFCSLETAEMLPELRSAQERVKWFEGMEGNGTGRKLYGHLKQRNAKGCGKKLWPLTKDERHELDLDGEPLFVTLLDANHMIGAVMFLFEWRNKAILYTGDIRVESHLLEYLSCHPVARKFVDKTENNTVLDKIYLDTSMVLCDRQLVSKRQATRNIIELIELYPTDTRFFLNCWTPGFEDMLTSIAEHFDTTIHIDAYKHMLFNLPSVISSHPSLRKLSSLRHCCSKPHRHLCSSTSRVCSCGYASFPCPCKCIVTRFHACERKWKCDNIWGEGWGCYEVGEQHLQLMRGRGKKGKNLNTDYKDQGKGIVYISPFDRDIEHWEHELAKKIRWLKNCRRRWETGEKVEDWPETLCCPLSRHSTLPELRSFVELFKPQSLYPNTISGVLEYMDYEALPLLFSGCLAPGGYDQLKREWEKERAAEDPVTFDRRAKIFHTMRAKRGMVRLYDTVTRMSEYQTKEDFLADYGVADPLDLHNTEYLTENTEGDEVFVVRKEAKLEELRTSLLQSTRNTSYNDQTEVGRSSVNLWTSEDQSHLIHSKKKRRIAIEKEQQERWKKIKIASTNIARNMRNSIQEQKGRGILDVVPWTIT